MEIRIRSTGQVMLEDELRRWAKDNNGPSWDRTTDEVLEALGADVVFEGPQATGGEFWQFSMRQGVEQLDGKWYTKYVLGPIFTDRPATETEPAQTAGEQQAAYVAQKTAERDAALQKSIVDAAQKRLDDFAQSRNYDDVKSACDYAGCSVQKFSIEGQYCKDKRAETWAKLYEILAEVQAGTRPAPTGFADVEPDLPALEWPL